MIDCNGDATKNERRGHNIVAIDYSMNADATLDTAPGGTYDADNLACSSCHDPHGKYRMDTAGTVTTTGGPIGESGSYGAAAADGTGYVGAYRILGGDGYTPKSTGYAFTNDVPFASAPSTYNTAAAGGARVGYGSGMSEWCANCHDLYFNTDPDSASGKHPTSVLLSKDGLNANYNSYVKTGDFSGVQATSYDPLVPFETGDTVQQDLIDNFATTGVNNTSGPNTGSEQVMCLSCHRAHASAFNNMGRWEFETEFIAEAEALTNTGVPAGAAIYYDNYANIDVVAKYGDHQRSLCNKCHVQD
jgi:cytochrome c553